MYWPDGTPLPHDQCPMAVVLKEGRAVSGQEAVVERPDGTRMPFMAFPSPLRDTTGEIVGAVNMFVDITERVLMERCIGYVNNGRFPGPSESASLHATGLSEPSQLL